MTEHICPPDHKHEETTTCYNGHECRCQPCRSANSDRTYYRRHMIAAGRTDVFDCVVEGRGVNRRLQALHAIGWSWARIGSLLDGLDKAHIRRLATHARVTYRTHERIAALYDEISDRPAPQNTTGERIAAQKAIHQAQRLNWARPIDWDDIDLDPAPPVATDTEDLVDVVAVQLVLEGTQVKLSRAERHLAVTALHARRYQDKEIAQLLGVADRTILRDRQHLGLPANEGTYEERFAA